MTAGRLFSLGFFLQSGIWHLASGMAGPAALAAEPAAECRALIVAGDPGTERRSAARFADWTSRWVTLLKDTYGFKPANIRVLRNLGTLEKVAPAGQRADLGTPFGDFATHKSVLDAFAGLVRESKPEDQTVLVLIGHGYDSQGIGKFCLAGKDLSDVEAGQALSGLRAREFICFQTATASQTWAKALGRSGRAIVVATGMPGMRSQTYFCEFLLRALRPGNVSLLDAFNRASLNTVRWYQNQFVRGDVTTVHGKEFQEIWKAMYPDRQMEPGSAAPQEPVNDPERKEEWLGRRVIPEVAGLDDNGDGVPSTILDEEGKATPLPSKSGDGALARKIVLGKP